MFKWSVIIFVGDYNKRGSKKHDSEVPLFSMFLRKMTQAYPATPLTEVNGRIRV